MPDGDVIAGGLFTEVGTVTAAKIARWNGTTWSPLGTGTDPSVAALASAPSGTLFVGGSFQVVNGTASPYLARYESTCPATATPHGLGCASSGGGNVLEATAMPWVDATFRARGTGLPANAFIIAKTSLTAIPQGAVPLAAFFAEGVVGCDVLVVPDILQGIFTTNGIAETQLFLPNTPPLVGVAFYHQMIPFEIDPVLGVTAITATNSLRLVAGDF
jgi:hypothetical protein